MYLLGLVYYVPIHTFTWFVIILSISMFTLGAVTCTFLYRLPAKQTPTQLKKIKQDLLTSIDHQKFKTGIIILFTMGGLFLAVYLNSIRTTFGLETIIFRPYIVRAAIANGQTPGGFHYFYFMELVAVLVFIYFWLYKKHMTVFLYLIGIISTISLILTTAKVNITKVVVWCVVLTILLSLDYLNARNFALLMATLVTVGLSLFVGLSDWGGESFDNSIWSSYFTQDEIQINGNIVSAYIYNTGQIPTLDRVLHDSSIEHQYGKLTFLPISKIIRVFDRSFSVPSHIGKFYNIPYPFNVATYLDVMYKDFGVWGIISISFILGWIISFAYLKFLQEHKSLWLLYINSVFALWIFSSVSAASYIKPSYWFQIGAGFLLTVYCLPKRMPGPKFDLAHNNKSNINKNDAHKQA